jgi:hypothetical protein
MINKPERISPVMGTQFSIARFYGVIKFNGEHYIYNPLKDELVRMDVHTKEQKARHVEAKKARAEAKARKKESKESEASLF